MMPRAQRRGLVAILPGLLLAGCLAGPATEDSGVFGVAMMGPTCPVERDPPDPACADRPYQGKLAAATSYGGAVVLVFTTDAEGRFRVALPPGTYVLQDAPDAERLPACSSDGPVPVTEAAWTEANVSCDTGIR